MKKYKARLSKFLVVVYVISLFTFMFQTVKAEIAPGITVPPFSSLQSNAKLPDPFKFLNGTRMTSKEQWAARREEISALAQTFEYGIKPAKPQTVTGSFSSNAITVTCGQNGKSISFKCSIQYPTTGKAPYPAMIGINMNTLNTSEILKLGVALITFPADEIGQETNASSRGKGKFFDLYGSNYDAGALMAWAWGVDRLIDVLEITPTANIDPKRLGVTGGSRNGKGALCVGAFDERIALTVPQESGNGGASGWRTADAQMASGTEVQTLSEIIGENCWFAKALNQFSGNTNKLPYDHHEVLALCAPRGLLVIENPDFTWLGNLSCYETSTAGHMVYEALNIPDRMGYSSIGGHGHCQFPASQQPELTAYIKKFLLGDSTANTTVFRSDKTYTFNKTKWVDWTIPSLSGELTSSTPAPTSSSPTPTPTPTRTPTRTPTYTPIPTPKDIEDINGDGAVNMTDIMLQALAFNSVSGSPAYNVKYDLDKNGAINMSDIMITAAKFNKTVS